MTSSFIFKTDRPWPNARLDRAAIIGHTTANSTKIWMRLGLPGSYRLFVYPMANEDAQSFRKRLTLVPFDSPQPTAWAKVYSFDIADFSSDTTFVQVVEDLQPYTTYGYAIQGKDDAGVSRILIGQDGLDNPLAYSFRTLSAGPAPFSFGFYSCHLPYKKSIFGGTEITNMDMWDSFLATLQRNRKEGELAFVIGGGDLVYVDGVDSLNIWKYLNQCINERSDALPDKDAMLSWYRDIYRGYWGFPQITQVFSQFPIYMSLDDHEILDGWGSYFLNETSEDEMDEIFPDWKKSALSWKSHQALLENMGECAIKVYDEYEHSHNPDSDFLDYNFSTNGSAFYFLDGRSARDINRQSNRVLGREQLARFSAWLKALDPKITPYVFVVSAVPLLHLHATLLNSKNPSFDVADLEDDLRDAWEHKLHDMERKQMVELLFEAAGRGLKVSILSGDVHGSAAFRLSRGNSIIYQLTSSPITYNVSLPIGWALSAGVVDEGESSDGYRFKRLGLYMERNYALVTVDAFQEKAEFQIYGAQSIANPQGTTEDFPVTHALMKFELGF
jgi:alkaline phosphatase D